MARSVSVWARQDAHSKEIMDGACLVNFVSVFLEGGETDADVTDLERSRETRAPTGTLDKHPHHADRARIRRIRTCI